MAKTFFQCALCECTSDGTEVKRAHRNALYCSWCADEMARTGRAWCGTGRHTVPIYQMIPHKTIRRCYACHRASSRAYDARHREAINAKKRAAYAVQPKTETRAEQCRAASRRYYTKRRTAMLKRAQVYAQTHADQRRARRRAHYWANPEQARAKGRLYRARVKLAILRGWQH